MFEAITMQTLRSQMEQHLSMVEEVLGGLDMFVQGLEQRVTRIEAVLGIEPEGLTIDGLVADVQRIKQAMAATRSAQR
jgi:hypothetical protein